LATVYPLNSLTCRWNWFAPQTAGDGLKVIQFFATVIAAGLVVAFGMVTFNIWQHTQSNGNDEVGKTKAAPILLLAFVSTLLNSLYLLIIILSLAPIVGLPGCG
jgi:hypothetical protein